jgi:cytoskeleton protein RodZ
MESLQAPLFGNQLRKKREEKRLTLDDVAGELRLKKELINDIENDNYDKIQPAYLKGYLRSYAKMLAIPYHDRTPSSEFIDKDRVTPSCRFFYCQKQVSAGDTFIQWITYSIISILLLLVIQWWGKEFSISSLTSDQKDTETTA